MGYQNAYNAYQKTNVSTASQGRLVVLLYEGAVKNLTGAINLFDENEKIRNAGHNSDQHFLTMILQHNC